MAGFDTAQVLGLLVGSILPLIVGLVTKASWHGGVKAILLAALSALTGFVTSAWEVVSAGEVFDWRSALVVAVGAFVTGVGVHLGLWKPTGATAVVQNAVVKD